MTVPKKKSS